MKRNRIIVGGRYRHYKGNEYVILAVGKNSENPDEELVVYQGQYDDSKFGQRPIWIRPKKMFLETIRVNWITIPRFRLTHSYESEGV